MLEQLRENRRDLRSSSAIRYLTAKNFSYFHPLSLS